MTNAINFIKENGVEKAREVISGAPDWAMSINFNNGMYYSRMEHKKGDTFLYDIKRLVESVDLLKSNGGYEEAKDTFDFAIKHGMNDLTEFGSRLKQAIADYESIGGEHV